MAEFNVLFSGPLPKPVHGFSIINERVLSLLRMRANTFVFDVKPATMRWGSAVARILRVVRLPVLTLRFFLLCVFRDIKAFYIGFSGGRGQLLDAILMGIARLFSIPTFIHHHSFAYLNKVEWHSRIAIAVAKQANHIALCDGMADLLITKYRIDPANVRVVSNVGFLSATGIGERKTGALATEIVLGYLSNISAEKGIFEFFAMLEALRSRGCQVSARIAGPVIERDRIAFHQRLNGLSTCEYIGPVYGREKDEFLSGIDLLVFPTKYANEAEPLVLWEAMGAGVPVISANRGCINCVIPPKAGLVAGASAFDLESAVEAVRSLANDPEKLQIWKMGAYNHFQMSRVRSLLALDRMLDEMTRRPPPIVGDTA